MVHVLVSRCEHVMPSSYVPSHAVSCDNGTCRVVQCRVVTRLSMLCHFMLHYISNFVARVLPCPSSNAEQD